MIATKQELHTLTRGAASSARAPAPTIAQPPARWGTRVVLPLGIFALAAALLLYAGRVSLWPAIDVQIAPVIARSSAGETRGGEVRVQAPGWIEPAPFASNVSALAEGVVEEVLVLEGQQLKEGDVVARLIDADARLARAVAAAELGQRQAELASARADLEAARTAWEHPTELVRAAVTTEAIYQQHRGETGELDAALKSEIAKADELKDQYERLAQIADQRAVTEAELNQSRLRFESQAAAAEAARARCEIHKAKLLEQEAETAAAREALELRIEPRRALKTAEAQVAQSEAMIERAETALAEAELRLERMLVKTPVAGIVMARLVEPGTRIMLVSDMPQAGVIARLYDPQQLQVRVDIPLSDAAKVGIGQPAEIQTEALPDQTFKGSVRRLVHEANIQKNTVQVKVAIEDPSPELRPEMLARVKFFGKQSASAPVASESLALYAPREGLRDIKESQAVAWVVDQATSSATRREVGLGAGRLADAIEVTSGLRPGDKLIIGNPAGLREGIRVRIIGEALPNGGN